MPQRAVNPTRMMLLRTKNRIKLAQKGHKLLRKKRDSLVMQFFEAAKKARGVRDNLASTMDSGFNSLIKEQAITGVLEVGSIAESIPEMPEIELKLANVMGVRIPKIEYTREDEKKRGYSLMFTSTHLDRAVDDFNQAKNEILELVETEETLKRLSDEIVKTKRRVNALEYVMIPELIRTQKYITAKLEEMERENFFRLKTVKKKKDREMENAG